MKVNVFIYFSFNLLTYFLVHFFVHEQIDTRKESMIQFVAPSSYPVITFGPFPSPQAVLISLSHAIGNFLNHLAYALVVCSSNVLL